MEGSPYVVMQAHGHWSIQFSGRLFDRFDDKEDAVLTAIIWSASAERHGLHVKVFVEENGHRRAVWGEHSDPGSGPAVPRARRH